MPFDYGDKRADGQHEHHPVQVPADRAFVRPVRLSYQHLKCGAITNMSRAIAETYAATPAFYGKTFCCACRDYYPVGPQGEFVWVENGAAIDQRVGT